MKMEQTECSETTAYKIQTLGNYPEEIIQKHYIICVFSFKPLPQNSSEQREQYRQSACNHCRNGDATLHSLRTVDLQVTVNNIQIMRLVQQCFCNEFISPSWVLHVKCPIFLPDFNQIWIFSTDFHETPQHQISRKSIQWEQRRHMPTHGQTLTLR